MVFSMTKCENMYFVDLKKMSILNALTLWIKASA